jgi:hypothetical protein
MQVNLTPFQTLSQDALLGILFWLNSKEVRICILVSKRWAEPGKQSLINLLKDKVNLVCYPAFDELRSSLGLDSETLLPSENNFREFFQTTLTKLRSDPLSLRSLRKAWNEFEHHELQVLDRQTDALLKFKNLPHSNFIGKWHSIYGLKEELKKEPNIEKLLSIFQEALNLHQPMLAEKVAIEVPDYVEKAILLNELVKYYLLEMDLENANRVANYLPDPLKLEVKTRGLDSFDKGLAYSTASNTPIKKIVDLVFEQFSKELKTIKKIRISINEWNIEKIEKRISKLTSLPFYQSLALREFSLKLFEKGSSSTIEVLLQIPCQDIKYKTVLQICKHFKMLNDWEKFQKYVEILPDEDQQEIIGQFFRKLCENTPLKELEAFIQKIQIVSQRESALRFVIIQFLNNIKNFEDCIYAIKQLLNLSDSCPYKNDYLLAALTDICHFGQYKSHLQAYYYAADLILQKIQIPYQKSCWITFINGLCVIEEFDIAKTIAISCENKEFKQIASKIIQVKYKEFNDNLSKPYSLADFDMKRNIPTECWSFRSYLWRKNEEGIRYIKI